MRCAWQALVNLLPVWMRESVDRLGKDSLQEIHLRSNAPPELVLVSGRKYLERCVSDEDLRFVVNVATRYSPWNATTTSHGFITAQGGHRIGVCGHAVMDGEAVKGVHEITSLCVRVARDFAGASNGADDGTSSILVIGKPGSGKTTLLRDMIRSRSNMDLGNVSVVDEKEEIFPRAFNQMCFYPGRHTDIISGCGKKAGIEMVLRNMNPSMIAVDEITAEEDCAALLHAGWCGVHLIATAHAGSREDLLSRPVYKPLIQSRLFDYLIVLDQDKRWHREEL